MPSKRVAGDRVFFELHIANFRFGHIVIQIAHDVSEPVRRRFATFATAMPQAGAGAYAPCYHGCRIFNISRNNYLELGDFVSNDGRGVYGEETETLPASRVARKLLDAGVVGVFLEKWAAGSPAFFITTGAYACDHIDIAVLGKVVKNAELLEELRTFPVTRNLPKLDIFVARCGEFTEKVEQEALTWKAAVKSKRAQHQKTWLQQFAEQPEDFRCEEHDAGLQ